MYKRQALESPLTLDPSDWTFSRSSPREEYAPLYAPAIVPGHAEILRFPRGDRVAVLAAFRTPQDTTRHGRHDHHPPFAPAERFRGDSAQAGLFLIPLDGGDAREARGSGSGEGALLLEAPAGAYLASSEVWLPQRGFAARVRQGLGAPATPPGRLTLSDLVLLRRVLADSVTLEQAVEAVRPPGPVPATEAFAVGWEVYGVGTRGEVLSYDLSVTRTEGGFFRRVGELLRLSQRQEPLRLAWEEAGPDGPAPVFRTLELQIPALDPGEYVLRLEVTTRSGGVLASERLLHVTVP